MTLLFQGRVETASLLPEKKRRPHRGDEAAYELINLRVLSLPNQELSLLALEW